VNYTTCVIATGNLVIPFWSIDATALSVLGCVEQLPSRSTLYFLAYCSIEDGGHRWCVLFPIIRSLPSWIGGFAFGLGFHTILARGHRVSSPTSIHWCSYWLSLYARTFEKEHVKTEVTLPLTVSQYALVSSPLWDLWPDITSFLKVAV
jgi:hypothetical protein